VIILKELKNIGINLLWSLGLFLLLTLLLSLLHYFDLISNSFLKWSKIFIPLIAIFLGGFLNGRKAMSKGYLAGLKVGGAFVLLFFLFSILGFYSSLHFFTFVYYILLLLMAMLGAMLGIQKAVKHS